MNTQPAGSPIDSSVWQRADMRQALAQHDISTVYGLLGSMGISQRQISQLTGQSQSEVSDIARGRQVQAYDVLGRIADGLGIPRGYMGMAYADFATQQMALSGTGSPQEDGGMYRRTFLGIAGKIVMGAALTPGETDILTVFPQPTPVPNHVGLSDVSGLRELTNALRAYDAAKGGGSCRGAILAEMGWAESLLSSSCNDVVAVELKSAVAELKTLAGWTAHDLGHTRATEATQYLTQALELARDSGNATQSAIVLYHLGRVPLDNGDPGEALKVFMLGQIAAQESGASAAVALLLANQGLAYAQIGDPGMAMTALRRAEDEYAHARPEELAPEYMRFFDAGALQTTAARTYSALGLADSRHRADAISRLNRALSEGAPERRRQQAFNQIWLAACLIAEGDFDAGVRLGHEALAAVQSMRSTRLIKHLDPLFSQAAMHANRGDVRDLGAEIRELRRTA